MDLRLSETLTIILSFAREEAMRTGSYGISPDHLMLGMLRQGDNEAVQILRDLGIEIQDMKRSIDEQIFTNEHIPYSEFHNLRFSRHTKSIFSLTLLEAGKFRHTSALPFHLLLAIVRFPNSVSNRYLLGHDIDYGRILNYAHSAGYLARIEHGDLDDKADEEHDDILDNDFNSPDGLNEHHDSPNGINEQYDGPDGLNEHHDSPDGLNEQYGHEGQNGRRAFFNIEEFGYDLTKAAADGLLDPVVGREQEIQMLMEVINRRKKNNAMLIGDPGVGKSAIIEGLAIKIAAGQVPVSLKDKKILTLDIASVVAGTKFRGEFEQRLKDIIHYLKEHKEIIIFIDEFHTMVGAGASAGSLDAANILKPSLARGEIQCIGATTSDEYSKIIEKDGALNRRFQVINVKAADINYTIKILEEIKPNYEQHHDVIYDNEALKACARLTERYITSRCLPDKAIDAMDEAGSMVHLKSGKRVTIEDIATVISRSTGIPINKITETEGNRLIHMQERLESQVIGQDLAVETIVRAIQRGRAGIKDPNRPIGSFLFLGPTGVGKTLLAKMLAEYLFDSQDNIVRIDMSEYMEKINVTRLVGAPPGYVGYEEGGQLSERVRRKPYCVVLLDEIEKAHPDVFNLLLQVIDEGRLTDSNGRIVDFRNTILIMTSNIGSRELEDFGNGMGFKTKTKGHNIREDKRAIVDKAIKKAFSPEFINRIDELIYFNPLSKEDIGKIIDLELKGLYARAHEAGFNIRITPSARQYVAEQGWDPKFGARPLRRAIQKHIENPVSELIINEKINTSGQTSHQPCIRVSLDRKGSGTRVTLL